MAFSEGWKSGHKNVDGHKNLVLAIKKYLRRFMKNSSIGIWICMFFYQKLQKLKKRWQEKDHVWRCMKNCGLSKKAENENMKHTQLAVAFEAHFKRPISRQCITQVGVGEIAPCKCSLIQSIARDVDIRFVDIVRFVDTFSAVLKCNISNDGL